MVQDLPLFPLHSVLCPGIALPLHIFELRYRLMIGRCIEREQAFGVVLIRDGREVGESAGRIARVGTSAVIKQAGRYPDGRMDIVTVGARRFRIVNVDEKSEPYLIGRVTWLDDPMGGLPGEAEEAAQRVGSRFLEYLERLRPAPTPGGATPGGATREGERTEEAPFDMLAEMSPAPGVQAPEPFMAGDDVGDGPRRELLLASARRLIRTGDATAVSYLLTGLVQLDLSIRQELLELPDTAARLRRLDLLLAREIGLLGQHLRPLALDLGSLVARRN